MGDTMPRSCITRVTKRDPYRLPPNVDKSPCGRPAHSPTGMPTCTYHKKLEINASLRSVQRRIDRSHSVIEKQQLSGYRAKLLERLDELGNS